MKYPHVACAFPTIALSRTRVPGVQSAFVSLNAPVQQFVHVDIVKAAAETQNALYQDEDIAVVEAVIGLCPIAPTLARDLRDRNEGEDLMSLLSDKSFFSERAATIGDTMLSYMDRAGPDLSDAPIAAIAVIDELHVMDGFDEVDALAAVMDALSSAVPITSEDGASLLFLHSKADTSKTSKDLHDAMSMFLELARRYPQYKGTHFPRIGPMMGCYAGLIEIGRSWAPDENWAPIRTEFQDDPGWWTT